jgi:hypothetical protein
VIYAVGQNVIASKVLTQEMNSPRIKMIPLCLEAAAYPASLLGKVVTYKRYRVNYMETIYARQEN